MTDWQCPSCGQTTVTNDRRPHTPFHTCPQLAGLTAPFVVDGTPAEHRVNERDDYIGQERVLFDGNGRPIMSVVTVRDDGQDCTVYAPTAQAKANRE